jgi:hypothetical protein
MPKCVPTQTTCGPGQGRPMRMRTDTRRTQTPKSLVTCLYTHGKSELASGPTQGLRGNRAQRRIALDA